MFGRVFALIEYVFNHCVPSPPTLAIEANANVSTNSTLNASVFFGMSGAHRIRNVRAAVVVDVVVVGDAFYFVCACVPSCWDAVAKICDTNCAARVHTDMHKGNNDGRGYE